MPLRISASQLSEILTPHYLESVPEVDGWGYRYDYRLSYDPLGAHIMVISSSGSDGSFEESPELDGYRGTELYPAAETERDIVWSDGFFVRMPDGYSREEIRGRPDQPPARRELSTVPERTRITPEPRP